MGIAMMTNSRFDKDLCLGNELDEIPRLQRQKLRTLDELAARTKFSKREIQRIYQGFKQECPSGVVDERTFQRIHRQFFPFADTSSYARLIFATIDLRASGFVTFEDFLSCLSTLCRGTMEERLKWIFKLYDTNKSGRLTKNDLNASVSAVYALLGNVSNRATTPETLSERTASVFQKFDQSQRGYLTVDDFLSSCLKDPMVIQSIGFLCDRS